MGLVFNYENHAGFSYSRFMSSDVFISICRPLSGSLIGRESNGKGVISACEEANETFFIISFVQVILI